MLNIKSQRLNFKQMNDSNGVTLPERRKITDKTSTMECLSIIRFNDAIDEICLYLAYGATVHYNTTSKSASVTVEGKSKKVISLIL